MENSAMEHLRQLVRRLEDNPDMRKGVLTETLLRDASIEWDAIFYCLNLRGRHRAKMRWRRAVIQEAIRRPFLRGGARRSTVQMTPNPPIPSHPLKMAPWFVDVRELDSFHPQEVWDRFRMVFPVLAVYRSGWVTANTTADSPPHLDPSAWKTIWKEWRSTVDIIGHTLNWPSSVLDVSSLLVPFARKLWPEEPWEDWIKTNDNTVPRAIVPYLRRVACRTCSCLLRGTS